MSIVQATIDRDSYHEGYTWVLTPGDQSSTVEVYANNGMSVQVVNGKYIPDGIDVLVSNDGNNWVTISALGPNSISEIAENFHRYYRFQNPASGWNATVILFRRLVR